MFIPDTHPLNMLESVYKISADWSSSIFWNISSEVVICTKTEILVPSVVTILVSKTVTEFSPSGLLYNVRLFHNSPQMISFLLVCFTSYYVCLTLLHFIYCCQWCFKKCYFLRVYMVGWKKQFLSIRLSSDNSISF